MFVKVIL